MPLINNLNTVIAPVLTEEQIKAINKCTPKSQLTVKTDENGNKYTSVSSSYVKTQLMKIFGFDYDFQILTREYYQHSREVVVHARLTVRTSNGARIVREQFGRNFASLKKSASTVDTSTAAIDIGNAFKSAASDALKKCASELGICWDVYFAAPIHATPKAQEVKKSQAELDIEKEYARLEQFLAQCKTPQEVTNLAENFEANAAHLDQRFDDLVAEHLQRVTVQN